MKRGGAKSGVFRREVKNFCQKGLADTRPATTWPE
jgi:hypothetical protein